MSQFGFRLVWPYSCQVYCGLHLQSWNRRRYTKLEWWHKSRNTADGGIQLLVCIGVSLVSTLTGCWIHWTILPPRICIYLSTIPPNLFFFSSVTVRGTPIYLKNRELYHRSAGVKMTGKKFPRNSRNFFFKQGFIKNTLKKIWKNIFSK